MRGGKERVNAGGGGQKLQRLGDSRQKLKKTAVISRQLKPSLQREEGEEAFK